VHNILEFRNTNPIQELKMVFNRSLDHLSGIQQCTEVRFAHFLSGGFTTMAVINPHEKKLAKRTSVQCHIGAMGGDWWHINDH
jgi:hypothetical protein